jgi:hypothetical protein
MYVAFLKPQPPKVLTFLITSNTSEWISSCRRFSCHQLGLPNHIRGVWPIVVRLKPQCSERCSVVSDELFRSGENSNREFEQGMDRPLLKSKITDSSKKETKDTNNTSGLHRTQSILRRLRRRNVNPIPNQRIENKEDKDRTGFLSANFR